MRPASDPPTVRPEGHVVTRRPRRWRFVWVVPLALVTLVGISLAAGLEPAEVWDSMPWNGSDVAYQTFEVDRGDVPVFVLESGVLESANNSVVKCQVEAILGAIGGSSGMSSGRGGGGGGSSSGRGGGGGGGGGGSGGGGGGGGMSAAGTGGGMSSGAGGGAAGGTGTGELGSGGSGSGSGGSRAGGGGGSSIVMKPNIQSFNYRITPHMPLRSVSTGSMSSASSRSAAMGGGGNRGGGGGGDMMELSGSTRILTILPEGNWVEEGDVVCVLDSAPFEDELREQMIRFSQAESWVEQVSKTLEVTQIELREYTDGVFPQDKMLCEQFIESCQTQLEQARLNLEWVESALDSGLATPAQVQAGRFNLQRAQIALREAEGMKRRLENFARLRIIRELEAKIESVKSDLYSQQSAYQIEKDRKERLELNIERCTLRAPRAGIIVYCNETNGWGRVETMIQEGTTVREGQAIFQVPDPTKMLVKARVNESKISRIHSGQPALIRMDAFPDILFEGRVSEVTAIPSPAAGPISDVKMYEAVIHITDGIEEGLRPGMTAEISFFIAQHDDVPRVPHQAIREEGEFAFAAIATPRKPGYRWRMVEVGLVGQHFAEIVSGLQPGDQVITEPWELPAPALPETSTEITQTAATRLTRSAL